VLPFAALIVLIANARHLDAPLRAYVAAAAALSAWLVVEVAVFASRYSLRIEDRNLFYVMPLFLIALLAWIERGQPRPPRATVVAAGVAAALPGAIPFLGLLNINAQSDTLGLQPWWYVGDALAGRGSVSVVVVLTSLALGAAFLWLPRRYAPVLPVAVAAGFLLTWLPLQLWTHSFPRLASSSYAQGVSPGHRSWIDRAVGRNAHVGVVWAGGNELSVWMNEFWNRSVDRVYDLGKHIPGDMPTIPLAVDQATGILRGAHGETIRERYVLAPTSVDLLGKPIARDAPKNLVLYRVVPPARITTTLTGLYPEPVNPWSNANPVWTRYRCRGGTLTVVFSSDAQLFRGIRQTVHVTGTTPERTFRVPSRASSVTKRFPLTPKDGVCRVSFAISPARRPSLFPALHRNDSRLLGLHFDSIAYRAPR
jgi:hypothetical protein